MLAGNMTTRKTKLKHIANQIFTIIVLIFMLATYTHSLFASYNAGKQRKFYLLLAFIPFFFLSWGLNILLIGKDLRKISKNLTNLEKKESTRMAESFGGRMGMFVVGPFVIISLVTYETYGLQTILPYVVLVCLFFIITTPFTVLQRRRMKTFMFSTEYAVKQGYNKESANKASEATSEPAPSAGPSSPQG